MEERTSRPLSRRGGSSHRTDLRPIQDHVRTRWDAISSIPFPDAPNFFRPTRNVHGVYLSRTLVDVDASSIKPVTREIEFLFRDLIHLAERRIILEGQYYWSREINDLLRTKMRHMKSIGTEFEIVLILTDIQQLRALTQQMSFFELKLLEELDQSARETGCKLTLGCPYVFPSVEDTVFDREARPKPVYIHSKVMIIDDRFMSIGSANLAARALRLDTEINLTLEAEPDRNASTSVGSRIPSSDTGTSKDLSCTSTTKSGSCLCAPPTKLNVA